MLPNMVSPKQKETNKSSRKHHSTPSFLYRDTNLSSSLGFVVCRKGMETSRYAIDRRSVNPFPSGQAISTGSMETEEALLGIFLDWGAHRKTRTTQQTATANLFSSPVARKGLDVILPVSLSANPRIRKDSNLL